MSRTGYRLIQDRVFTGMSSVTVGVIVLILLVVLIPMMRRGFSAVLFSGTIEFRKMQYSLYQRGNESDIVKETQQIMPLRQELYDLVDGFKRGIDVEEPIDHAKEIYRSYGDYLRLRGVEREELSDLRGAARDIRDQLISAYETTDESEATKILDEFLTHREDERFVGTPLAELFDIGFRYRKLLDTIDLGSREDYRQNLEEVREALTQLLGPRPGEPLPVLAQEQFGATRWDMAERQIYRIIYDEVWEPIAGSDQLQKKVVSRAETQFKGTSLEPLFGMVETNATELLNPRLTVYWQYFFDDSTPGHYFGGVGPEIVGTLMISLLSMVFAIPLGIISAAYLIECAGDSFVIRLIRMCINTLAGVPSIVFGLFGLAFFVQWMLPRLGHKPEPCILTAAMTLAVLVLPVIIRASEEAIKSVPHTYKEASLSLGAGRFLTFIKVTLPAALPGILTGVILSLSRAAGETAPLLFTGAVALGPIVNIFEPNLGALWRQTRTLSYGSYDLAVGDRLAMQVPHNQYGMVIALIMLVMCLNIVAIVIRSRISKKLRGQ